MSYCFVCEERISTSPDALGGVVSHKNYLGNVCALCFYKHPTALRDLFKSYLSGKRVMGPNDNISSIVEIHYSLFNAAAPSEPEHATMALRCNDIRTISRRDYNLYIEFPNSERLIIQCLDSSDAEHYYQRILLSMAH